ncbi:MAG: ECF-type sigma factor [Phycisphaerales bacterium]|nr:sigma-70 family RNA polymerase sigma factor [Planctomycetota bacterium]
MNSKSDKARPDNRSAGPDVATPPPSPAAAQVTQLLVAAAGGDSRAARDLLPLVYEELRRLAQVRMAREPKAGAGMTLQPTALVHEAYLRLLGDHEVRWNGRGHFFGAAALAMRRILVERARHRGRIKHGGGLQRADMDMAQLSPALESEPPAEEMLALDDALKSLETKDRRKYDVVMLRYFAGLSIEETAEALSISPATVKNDWTFARAWLKKQVAGSDGDEASDSKR